MHTRETGPRGPEVNSGALDELVGGGGRAHRSSGARAAFLVAASLARLWLSPQIAHPSRGSSRISLIFRSPITHRRSISTPGAAAAARATRRRQRRTRTQQRRRCAPSWSMGASAKRSASYGRPALTSSRCAACGAVQLVKEAGVGSVRSQRACCDPIDHSCDLHPPVDTIPHACGV